MNINFTRDPANKNRFHLEGITESGEKKGVAGFHGGLRGIIGWISCYILHKTVPVQSKTKGVYYLNCKSLDNMLKRIGVKAPENIHSQKDVEKWLQQIKIHTPLRSEEQKPSPSKEDITEVRSIFPLDQNTHPEIYVEQVLPKAILEKGEKVTIEETTESTQVVEKQIANPDIIIEKILEKNRLPGELFTKLEIQKSIGKIIIGLNEPEGKSSARLTLGINQYLEFAKEDSLIDLLEYLKENNDAIKTEKLTKELKEIIKYNPSSKKNLVKVTAYLQNSVINSETEEEILRAATIRKEVNTKKDLKNEITNLLNDLNNPKFDQDELRHHTMMLALYMEDVEPLIKLVKHFEKTNQVTKAEKLKVALINCCRSLEPDAKEKIEKALK